MKTCTVLVSLLIAANVHLKAQCPVMTLGVLQSLQNTGLDEKQMHIQRQGFDLRSTLEKEGSTTLRYFKCWHTTDKDGNAIFQQVLLWNLEKNSLTFATLDKTQYDVLRQGIEGRQGNTGGNLDFYVGQKFSYRFGTQTIDGMEYFSVLINTR